MKPRVKGTKWRAMEEDPRRPYSSLYMWALALAQCTGRPYVVGWAGKE